MIGASATFPADFIVDDIDPSEADLVFEIDGGTIRRAVRVIPFSDAAEWSAALCVPRPLLNSACSGNFASPSADAVLLVEGGAVFRVNVADPADYTVVGTSGPVTQIEPIVTEAVVLLATPWSITSVTDRGVGWTTRRIAIDGLRLDEAADGWVRGVSDPGDDEPRDFAVNLATGDVIGGAEMNW